MCEFNKDGECTCDLPETEIPDCDTCKFYKAVDEFIAYVEWLRDEDAKLRGFDKA